MGGLFPVLEGVGVSSFPERGNKAERVLGWLWFAGKRLPVETEAKGRKRPEAG